MDARDYHLWKQMQQELRLNPQLAVNVPTIAPEEELEDDVFEAVSKRAWTDILLQILKVQLALFDTGTITPTDHIVGKTLLAKLLSNMDYYDDKRKLSMLCW